MPSRASLQQKYETSMYADKLFERLRPLAADDEQRQAWIEALQSDFGRVQTLREKPKRSHGPRAKRNGAPEGQ